MPFVFKESPDRMRLDALVSLDFDHSNANTFCFPTRNTVATSRRPHSFIFNAMTKAVADLGNQKKHFKDYEAKLYGRIGPEDVKAVKKTLTGTMGQRRTSTLAGRAWVGVRNKALGTFHALSFWSTEAELKANQWVFPLVIEHFKLTGAPIYFEGIDSKEPKIYRDFFDDLAPVGGGLKSTVDPSLTQEEIIEILVKAHTAPYSLTAKEREVVYELRGKPVPRKFRHRFPTDAEFNAVRSTSEGVAYRSGLLEPLGPESDLATRLLGES
jgi:hypothetical protein